MRKRLTKGATSFHLLWHPSPLVVLWKKRAYIYTSVRIINALDKRVEFLVLACWADRSVNIISYIYKMVYCFFYESWKLACIYMKISVYYADGINSSVFFFFWKVSHLSRQEALNFFFSCLEFFFFSNQFNVLKIPFLFPFC